MAGRKPLELPMQVRFLLSQPREGRTVASMLDYHSGDVGSTPILRSICYAGVVGNAAASYTAVKSSILLRSSSFAAVV